MPDPEIVALMQEIKAYAAAQVQLSKSLEKVHRLLYGSNGTKGVTTDLALFEQRLAAVEKKLDAHEETEKDQAKQATTVRIALIGMGLSFLMGAAGLAVSILK